MTTSTTTPVTTPVTPTALDVQDLRARLHRRLRWTRAAGLAAAVLAMTSAIMLTVIDRHLSDEQAELDHRPGQIVAVSGSDSDDSEGWADVEFTQAGRTRNVRVHLDDTASFSPGPATVLVDPRDPSFVTLPGENYFRAGPGLALLLVGGFGACALVLCSLAYATARNVSVLADSQWKTVTGFVARVGSGDSEKWVLFLPDDAGSSFWRFGNRLPVPRFTGSVAIDGRGRMIHRLADGKLLAFATRDKAVATWTSHRLVSARRDGDVIEFHYFESDRERSCRVQCDELDGDTAASVTSASTINVLAGPLNTAVVHVASVGVIGIGVVGKVRERRRQRRLAAAFRYPG